jgi:hypothetical protein
MSAKDCSYVGTIFKYVLAFSAGTMCLISFKVKMLLTLEVDIMVYAILWISLVAGITLLG